MANPAPEGGFTMIPNWIIRDSNLTPNEMAVYIALRSRADGAGLAWPSISRIAKETRTSPRTVRTALKSLERRGAVTKQVRPRGGARNDTNLYRVTVYSADWMDDGLVAEGGGYTSRTQWVQETQGVGAGDAVEEEPLEEDPSEQNLRSELALRREISFGEPKAPTPATPAQVNYLRDLHIHYNNEIPNTATVARWEQLTTKQANDLIHDYLKQMPRYDGYVGPEQGDPEYAALSDEGKRWADEYMLPDWKNA